MQETVTVIEEKHIPEKAWYGRSDLIRVRLKNVWSVGPYAFSGCPNLTALSLPDSLTTIGHGAFNGCARLTRLSVPAGVTAIGHGAFASCPALTLSAPRGSCAARYCEERGLPCALTDARG